ncbi:MAG: PDZ domain-containing protein [Phycisphaerae bacterium]|nr:PDZ domain-containing protein [Phycisphaerae bacterium]
MRIKGIIFVLGMMAGVATEAETTAGGSVPSENLFLPYGLYVHYGPMTMAADGGAGNSGGTSAQRFVSVVPDVRQWVQVAKDAGMAYVVLTVKHEGGFCLWDSPDYPQDVGSATGQKDIVRLFLTACRAAGLKAGVHYSIPDAYNEGQALYKGPVGVPYFTVIKKHITELHTKYKEIDIQLFDVAGRLSKAQKDELTAVIRKFNPRCTILGLSDESLGFRYEARSVNAGWAWKPGAKLTPAEQLQKDFAKFRSEGKSFLLNVGPDAQGRIPDEQIAVLTRLKELVDAEISPEAAQAAREGTEGTMVGIGVELDKAPGGLTIKRVMENSPADKAGLKDGQTITAINGAATRTMNLPDAIMLIRGPAGTEVELTISEAGGGSRKVRIQRDTVVVSGVRAKMLDSKVGLLTVNQVNKETAGKVRGALEIFTDMKAVGVILDLRNNQGGWYLGVRQIAGMMMGDSVPLWLLRETGKTQATVVQGEGAKIWTGPLVVLVNGKTGGGAELLAAGLQSSGRAKLMGQTTAGTAMLSSQTDPAGGGAGITAIGDFFTVADQKIYGVGIKPDMALEAGLTAEEALRKAIDILKTK